MNKMLKINHDMLMKSFRELSLNYLNKFILYLLIKDFINMI